MRHSSKVSALRRELNSHNAAQPRPSSQLRARAQPLFHPARKQVAPTPRPFESTLSCIGALSMCQEWGPRPGLQRRAAGVRCRSSCVAVPWLSLCQCPPRAALPNPSFKPSSNGVPRGPGWRYAVHFRHPGPRVTPSVPA